RGKETGAKVKFGKQPYKPDWKAALSLAQAAPRRRARVDATKMPCRGPAMRGRRVRPLHGGKGGAPLATVTEHIGQAATRQMPRPSGESCGCRWETCIA